MPKPKVADGVCTELFECANLNILWMLDANAPEILAAMCLRFLLNGVLQTVINVSVISFGFIEAQLANEE